MTARGRGRETTAGSFASAVAAAGLAALLIAGAGCGRNGDEMARHAAELAQLKAQVAELQKGQEAADRQRALLAEQLKSLDAQQAFVLADVKASREELSRMEKAVEQSEAAVSELRTAIAEVRRTVQPAALSAGRQPLAPDALYAEAMANVRADQLGQAVVEFTELVDRFPKHPLASNAQYWIGESHYRQRDYGKALAQFQKLIGAYPDSPQVPEALLKIGLCHRALKDASAARESWEQLVKRHGGSEAAARARALLSELGDAGRSAR